MDKETPMPPDHSNVLDTKLTLLHEDITEIKVALGKLSDAIVKLALVEQRQTATTAALERAFTALEAVEKRVASLELESANSARISKWIDRGILAVLAGVGAMVLKKIGVL